MNHKNWRLYFELAWWTFVLLVLIGVITPILLKVPDYPFLVGNIVFIIAFLTFFRWIFLLRFSWFATNKWIKLIIMFLTLPMVVLLFEFFTEFQGFMDDYGLQTILDHLSFSEYKSLEPFIRFEMLFFGVGSIISAFIVGVRMMVSIWLYRNRGRV